MDHDLYLIDHPVGHHDDYANVTCLAVAVLAKISATPWFFFSGGRQLGTVEPVAPIAQRPSLVARTTAPVGRAAEVISETVSSTKDTLTTASKSLTQAAADTIGLPPLSEQEAQRIRSLAPGCRPPEDQHRLDHSMPGLPATGNRPSWKNRSCVMDSIGHRTAFAVSRCGN